MKKSKNFVIWLGIFVTIAVALFVFASYLIGNNQNLFRATFVVSAEFPNVNGLQEGNNVHYAGIKVGTVQQIEILNDSSLRVDMILDEKVQKYIKRNAVASIGSDGLVGNMIVNISPGKGEAPAVEDGGEIASYSRVKTDDIINTLGKTNENLAVLSNDLLTITEQIKNGQGTLAMLLQDSLLADNLRMAVSDLRGTSAYLSATSRQLNGIVAQVESGDGLIGALLQDTVLKDRLDRVVTRIDTGVMVQVDSIVLDLRRTGDDLHRFSNDLNRFSDQLNQGEGLVATALRDTAVANDLREILQNVNHGTELFNENMRAVRSNFLFRGYFKKQEQEERKAAEAANR